MLVAEGPGHQRDTYLVLAQNGLETELRSRKLRFFELNRDDVAEVRVRTRFTGLGSLWIPQTVLRADVVVSMPKVKDPSLGGSHAQPEKHVRDRPRLRLRLAEECPALERHRPEHPRYQEHDVRVRFVIADGIVAMEGNGPRQGEKRQLGRIVMADNPVAADFTCARLMWFNPYRISHLAQAAQFLGNGDMQRIQQLAEPLPAAVRSFAVLPDFKYLVSEAS